MRNTAILKPMIHVILGTALALTALGFALRLQGVSAPVLTPEGTAGQFLQRLKRHEYTAARQHLSQKMRGQISEDQLQVFMEQRESRRKGIAQVHEERSDIEGDSAWAFVHIQLQNREEKDWAFPLVKENGVWTLASVGCIGTTP